MADTMQRNRPTGDGGGNSALITLVVVVVIALAVWIAYAKGYIFGGNSTTYQSDNASASVQVTLPSTQSTVGPGSGNGY